MIHYRIQKNRKLEFSWKRQETQNCINTHIGKYAHGYIIICIQNVATDVVVAVSSTGGLYVGALQGSGADGLLSSIACVGNDHHIDWTSTCILGVESHYWSERQSTSIGQPSSLNRGKGTLPDMYDFIIL